MSVIRGWWGGRGGCEHIAKAEDLYKEHGKELESIYLEEKRVPAMTILHDSILQRHVPSYRSSASLHQLHARVSWYLYARKDSIRAFSPSPPTPAGC